MTNAEARFNKSLRPRKPEGSLGRTAQDIHLVSHTAPELCVIDSCSDDEKNYLLPEIFFCRYMKKKKQQLLVHKNVKTSSGNEIQQISHQHSAD